MAQKLEVEKIVKIYQNPITEQKPEGFARLIKQISSEHYSENTYLENWEVQFEMEERCFQRMILALQN